MTPIVAGLSTSVIDDFILYMSQYNLSQVNSIKNSNDKFVDLVFSSDPSNTICHVPLTATSFDRNSIHHSSICIEIIAGNESNTIVDEIVNPFRTNLKHTKLELLRHSDMLRSDINSINDIESIIILFSDVMHKCSQTAVRGRICHSAPWLHGDKRFELAKKKQQRLYRIYKKTRSVIDKNNYLESMSQSNVIFSLLKDKYYKRIISNADKNPSSLFTLARTRKTSKELIRCDMYLNGVAISTSDRDTAFCDHLADNFSHEPFPSRYSNEQNRIDFHKIHSEFFSDDFSHFFNNLDLLLNNELLSKYISEIDEKKDTGPHQISIQFIRYNYFAIEDILIKMCNYILSTGDFPSSFKNSFIVPIPKKGSAREITNYRGIALQSIIPKLIDKHIANITISLCNFPFPSLVHFSMVLSAGEVPSLI